MDARACVVDEEADEGVHKLQHEYARQSAQDGPTGEEKDWTEDHDRPHIGGGVHSERPQDRRGRPQASREATGANEMTYEPGKIHHRNCRMEGPGQGDGYQNVLTEEGTPLFAVPEGEYPKGTKFDVVITYTAKLPAKHTA
jgi:hypothetical protein